MLMPELALSLTSYLMVAPAAAMGMRKLALGFGCRRADPDGVSLGELPGKLSDSPGPDPGL